MIVPPWARKLLLMANAIMIIAAAALLLNNRSISDWFGRKTTIAKSDAGLLVPTPASTSLEPATSPKPSTPDFRVRVVPHYNDNNGQVWARSLDITSVDPDEVLVREVVVNGRPECTHVENKKLLTGDSFEILFPLAKEHNGKGGPDALGAEFLGQLASECGDEVIRVTIVTDKGDSEYKFGAAE